MVLILIIGLAQLKDESGIHPPMTRSCQRDLLIINVCKVNLRVDATSDIVIPMSITPVCRSDDVFVAAWWPTFAENRVEYLVVMLTGNNVTDDNGNGR